MSFRLIENSIYYAPKTQASNFAADLILENIEKLLLANQKCSVMLTGGNTAMSVYKALGMKVAFQNLSGVNFFLGDERCVPSTDVESNFRMVMDSLFNIPNFLDRNTFHRMEADLPDLEVASKKYEDILPPSIDLLLLSLGSDGHLASLFPLSHALLEKRKLVMFTISPKYPFRRLTVTPPVILNAKKVIILAFGKAKRIMLNKVLGEDSNLLDLPAIMVKDKIWLCDELMDFEA
jgi:6-phosphogluconolactonase